MDNAVRTTIHHLSDLRNQTDHSVSTQTDDLEGSVHHLEPMKRLLPILLLMLSACGGRPAANAPKEDPRIAEEKRLRELFRDAPYIITRQEQLDSLLELADARIAEQPSPEAYLHRLSLHVVGQQWEKELSDAEAGLALLSPGDTSEIAIKLRNARAAAVIKCGRKGER